MNVEYVQSFDSYTLRTTSSDEREPTPTTLEVLEELFHLLEDYAPTWYTEEHHNRAVAALRGATQPENADVKIRSGTV